MVRGMQSQNAKHFCAYHDFYFTFVFVLSDNFSFSLSMLFINLYFHSSRFFSRRFYFFLWFCAKFYFRKFNLFSSFIFSILMIKFNRINISITENFFFSLWHSLCCCWSLPLVFELNEFAGVKC